MFVSFIILYLLSNCTLFVAHITDNEREKRAFLNDLDALIRVGSHSNVVGLVGGCEERGAIFFSF